MQSTESMFFGHILGPGFCRDDAFFGQIGPMETHLHDLSIHVIALPAAGAEGGGGLQAQLVETRG